MSIKANQKYATEPMEQWWEAQSSVRKVKVRSSMAEHDYADRRVAEHSEGRSIIRSINEPS